MNKEAENTSDKQGADIDSFASEYQAIRGKFVKGDFKGAAVLFEKLYNNLKNLDGQNPKEMLNKIIEKTGVDHIDFVMMDVLSKNFPARMSDLNGYLGNFRAILEDVGRAHLNISTPNLDQFLVNGAKLNKEVLSGLLIHYNELDREHSTAAKINLLSNLQDHILKNNPSDSNSIKLIQAELFKLFLLDKHAMVDDMIENPPHALFIMKNPDIMGLIFNEANVDQRMKLIDNCKPELGRAIVMFSLLGDKPAIYDAMRRRLPEQDNTDQRKFMISLFAGNEGHLNESTLSAYLQLYDNPVDRLEILKTMFDEIESNASGKYPATGFDIRRLLTGYSSRQIEDIRLVQNACAEVLRTSGNNNEVQRFISGENANVNSARDLTELLNFETRLFTFDPMTKVRAQTIDLYQTGPKDPGNPQMMIKQLFAATPSGESPFNAYGIISIIGKRLYNPAKKITKVDISEIAHYMLTHPEHAHYFLRPRSLFLGGRDFRGDFAANEGQIATMIVNGTPELRQVILKSGVHLLAENKDTLLNQLSTMIKADKVVADNISFVLNELSKIDDKELMRSVLKKVAADAGIDKSSVIEDKNFKKSAAIRAVEEMLRENPALVDSLEKAMKEAMTKKVVELRIKFEAYKSDGAKVIVAVEQALRDNSLNVKAGDSPESLYSAMNALQAYIKRVSTLPEKEQYADMSFEDILKLYAEMNEINGGMKDSYELVKKASEGVGKGTVVQMQSVSRGTPAEAKKYPRGRNMESQSQDRSKAPEVYASIDSPVESSQLTPEMIRAIRNKHRGEFVGANVRQKRIDQSDLKDYPLSNEHIKIILERAEKIHRLIAENPEAKKNPSFFMDNKIRNELRAILSKNINSKGQYADISRIMSNVKAMYDRYELKAEKKEFKQREGEVSAKPSVLSSIDSKLPGRNKGVIAAMKEQQVANSVKLIKDRIADAYRFMSSEVKGSDHDVLIRRAKVFVAQIEKDNTRFKQDNGSSDNYAGFGEVNYRLQEFIRNQEQLKSVPVAPPKPSVDIEKLPHPRKPKSTSAESPSPTSEQGSKNLPAQGWASAEIDEKATANSRLQSGSASSDNPDPQSPTKENQEDKGLKNK